MCGVPMDATFHGGSNDTIGGRVRLRRPEILHRFVPIFRKIRPLSSIQFIISEQIFSGVDDTADKTVLPILECLHLKIKNKQIFYRCKVHPPKLLT